MSKSNISHPVSSAQRDSFKEHAVAFAMALNELDPNSSIKGRKRVNILAKACGYNDHSQLIKLARGFSHTSPLLLFTREAAPNIGRAMADQNGLKFELVIASIIKSADSIYSDAENRWKVRHIIEYDEKVWMLILPGMSKIAKTFKTITFPYERVVKRVNKIGNLAAGYSKNFATIQELSEIHKNMASSVLDNSGIKFMNDQLKSPIHEIQKQLEESPFFRLQKQLKALNI